MNEEILAHYLRQLVRAENWRNSILAKLKEFPNSRRLNTVLKQTEIELGLWQGRVACLVIDTQPTPHEVGFSILRQVFNLKKD